MKFIGFIIRKKPSNAAESVKETIKEPEKVPAKVILKDKVFIMYCLVLVFYMASQQTCTSWLPLFLEKDFNASNAVVAATTMSFWIGIAVMRLLSPVLLKTNKINALQTTAWGLALSFVSMIGITSHLERKLAGHRRRQLKALLAAGQRDKPCGKRKRPADRKALSVRQSADLEPEQQSRSS